MAIIPSDGTSVGTASAIALAAPGDTVTLPSGTFAWTSLLAVGKNITIRGEGVGQTILTRSAGFLNYSNNITPRLFGIEFRNSSASTSSFTVTVAGQNCVVGDCKFVGVVEKVVGIRATGGTGAPHPTGVVYNCEFLGSRMIVQGDIANSTTQAFGRRIWADLDKVVAFGSDNFMFFEDCVFDLPIGWTGNIADAEFGGCYVFRHNTVYNGGVFTHGITSNSERGTRMVEVYANNFIHEVGHAAPQDPMIRLRGGSAVVYDNQKTGDWSPRADMMVDMEYSASRTVFGGNIGDGNQAVDNGTGTHSGANGALSLTRVGAAWTTNAFVNMVVYNLTDGSSGTITANTATTLTASLSNGVQNVWDTGDEFKVTNGYPLRDQPGTGKDASFWGWGGIGPAQDASPMYFWDNTKSEDASPLELSIANNSMGWIQLGRDVINDGSELPGYTPYTYPHPLREEASTPTVDSISIDPSGLTTTVNLSESCTTGAGGNGGFTASASDGALVLTYVSGSGSSAYVFSNSRVVYGSESVSVSYIQPGDGVESTSNQIDLDSFTGTLVTNNSTQVPPYVPTPTTPNNPRQPRGPKKKR